MEVMAPPMPEALSVVPGPALLAGVELGPSLRAHLSLYGGLPPVGLDDILMSAQQVSLRGRGGAGFPFARKLQTAAAARGRPTLVVNLSEGEPASSKDAALAATQPHLVLAGAVLTARAVRAREIHVVVPGESPRIRGAIQNALAERGSSDGVTFVLHDADASFVAGQSAAVIELMSGRPNRPVTSWEPAAVRGYRGRPTVLSNAETFAQLAVLMHRGAREYAAHGTSAEPGTTLLTIHDGRGSRVVEAAFGTPWREVLAPEDLTRPVLLGGYHGTWAAGGALLGLTVSRSDLADAGLSLGAGVVLVPERCPLEFAATVADYLASQSAQRCGPCLNGLPALAAALRRVVDGIGGATELERLCQLVDRRGACAHPDGTVRMVRSALAAFAEELARHSRGGCAHLAAGRERW